MPYTFKELIINIILLIGITACSSPPKTLDNASHESKQKMLLRIADGAYENREMTLAINLYQQLYQDDPTNMELTLKLADSFNLIGDHYQAMNYYQIMLEQHYKVAHVRRGLAKIYIVAEQPQRALDELELILKENPHEHNALNGLGILLDLGQLHRTAQLCYQNGLALAPENLDLNNNFGISLALTGEFEQALVYLTKAYQVSSNAKENFGNLIIVQSTHEQVKRAPDKKPELIESMQQQLFNHKYLNLDMTNVLNLAERYC